MTKFKIQYTRKLALIVTRDSYAHNYIPYVVVVGRSLEETGVLTGNPSSEVSCKPPVSGENPPADERSYAMRSEQL